MTITRFCAAIMERMEYMLSSNWLNPFLTVYLNFRCFPVSYAWKLPVYVYGHPRIVSLRGSMRILGGGKDIKHGMITINRTQFGCPSNTATSTELCIRGLLTFHGRAIIGTGNKIVVELYGHLDIGDSVKITDYANVTCHESVSIGEQSWIVHRCQVMDSNFHYIANFKNGIIPRTSKPITIGNYCWICNSSTVTGGAVIPNKTIVASNSLVGKDYSDIPEESIIGGIPAKLIATGFRRVENKELTRTLTSFFQADITKKVYPLAEGVQHCICDA